MNLKNICGYNNFYLKDDVFMAFIEAKTNRLSQAKNTFQRILDSEQITKQQAIAQFRKYFSDRDPYYSFEFYNVLESLKNN